MKKLIFAIPILTMHLYATDITELFNSLKNQPTTKIDKLSSKSASLMQKKITSTYYPTFDMFASYTHYNSLTGLKPIDPLATAERLSKKEPLPFSKDITNIGLKISMPIFIKELSSLSEKANYLSKNAKIKKKINFLQNEAIIVGANSSLEYFHNLLIALTTTKKSLQKTKQDIAISVNSGKMAGIALDKIDVKLNEIEISINNIEIQKNNLISQIKSLTNITLEKYVPMYLEKNIETDNILLLKPLQNNIKATFSDIQASKEKRYYPKVAFNTMYKKSYAPDNVQDNRNLKEDYGYYQIALSMPIYDKSKDIDIQLKEIDLLKNQSKLEKTKQELDTQIKFLKQELLLLKKSQKLKKTNISKEEQLLKYAKISFDEGRMTQEDYMKYEDDVVKAKSEYFQTQAQIWQSISKLAVIYGNDLTEIIK